MSSDPVAPKGDGALVRPRVSPGAKRTHLRGFHGDTALKLRVDAPPVDGEANAAIERFLAEKTGVPPSDVRDGVGAERVREVLVPRPG
ncbi:MAG: hypothetical protein AVDCRST_MAG01-01-753 [uncultured Rubrobacteraceae bacterium]|uniref:Uncharacterized protein n=1 Tax=uncultured Rubrobacteraceae bacterium TaxID=349277 RepID=A0A6J4NV66_9ACTN|nr:MAG: hypothetical protein AVDCRST_MAG01-01-753 [uncultured Rubrobacteraceae bacterium]